MLPTQSEIESLASRIERTFTLRCNSWYEGCSTNGVWTAAAMTLWQVHVDNPEIPLDAELYVASQPLRVEFTDPWFELSSPEAGQRYRCRVERIIAQLREELEREIRRAERRVDAGHSLALVLRARDARLSPLGRFIVALKAGRLDLAQSLREKAAEQHNGCPLYRPASNALLPDEFYPTSDRHASREPKIASQLRRKITSLN